MRRLAPVALVVLAPLLAAAQAPPAAAPPDKPKAASPPTTAPSAKAAPAPLTPGRATLIAHAREVMTAAGVCALITIGPDGRAQARAIDFFEPEPDMTVWLATKAGTRKLGDIARDARVTVYCFDAKGPGYVALQGDATVVTDAAEKAKRWKEAWASFYEDRNRGADYVLVRVKPVRFELVSHAHNVLNDPKTWRPVEVRF